MNNFCAMKRTAVFLLFIMLLVSNATQAQTKSDYSKIDIRLINGDYKRAIDTCKLILATDSLNSEIWYKMGLAYQNLMLDDKSFDCFQKAAGISPDNAGYNFMVAKGYYNKGKTNRAKPILISLCTTDSLNWSYAFYLTSILMQEGRYDESVKIYNRFYKFDSTNYVYIDKLGFANLRKGEFETAIELFSKSLEINGNNINAIKNVASLYALTYRADTAVKILTRGIKIDPADMDLYVRRAALNFSVNYTKKALDDYLKIIQSGDSSVLYLKRAGIGYTYNLQPKQAIEFLLKAYKKDSSDYEVSSFLARNYQTIKDLKSSAYYYTHIIKTLNPVIQQLSLNYFSLAEVLKAEGKYKEAITAYLNGLQIRNDVNIYGIIANLYDEKLNDPVKAIYYYELYVKNASNYKLPGKAEYVDSVKKRIDFLKEKQATAVKN
jgi:tetratricopeptide (TPR) repeat protein